MSHNSLREPRLGRKVGHPGLSPAVGRAGARADTPRCVFVQMPFVLGEKWFHGRQAELPSRSSTPLLARSLEGRTVLGAEQGACTESAWLRLLRTGCVRRAGLMEGDPQLGRSPDRTGTELAPGEWTSALFLV